MNKKILITFVILIALAINIDAIPPPDNVRDPKEVQKETYLHNTAFLKYYYVQDYDLSFEYFPFENKNKALRKIGSGLETDSFSFYNGLGKVTQTQQRDNNRVIVVKTEYDKKGREKTISKPYTESLAKFGNKATSDGRYYNEFEYDGIDRIKKEKNFDGSVIEKKYGADYIKVKDEEGRWIKFTNDAFGNTVGVSEDSRNEDNYNSEFNYGYDTNNNLAKVASPIGDQLINDYNSLNQLVKTVSPDTGTILFSYDRLGNLETRTDENGVITRYYYDDLNRLIHTDYNDDGSYDVTYQYDSGCLDDENTIGRLCKITDRSGIMQFKYDERGRVIQQNKIIFENPALGINTQLSYTIKYSYNRADGVVSIQVNDEPEITYEYNQISQLESVALAGVITNLADNALLKFAYNPSSTINEISFGNLQKTSYGYTARDWVEKIDTGSMFKRSYGYDRVGNIDELYQGANKETLLASFDYDHVNRLTDVDDRGYYGKDIGFRYDALGNRQEVYENGLLKQTYAYGYEKGSYSLKKATGIQTVTKNSNLLLDIADASGAATALAYDVAGNLRTDADGDQLIYDEENRLIKATTPSGVDEYIYDADGNRVIKKDSTGTTIYVYDINGNNIYEETI